MRRPAGRLAAMIILRRVARRRACVQALEFVGLQYRSSRSELYARDRGLFNTQEDHFIIEKEMFDEATNESKIK